MSPRVAPPLDWNSRYATAEYHYGTEPNTFLADHADLLPGPALCIAEGEGRNAVFLAARGLAVTGVDLSSVALAKARTLAEARGVDVTLVQADLAEFEPETGAYGSVVSIFAHLSSPVRAQLYPRLTRAVRPGGVFLLEAFAEGQRARDTGGPKDPDLLMSVEKVRAELPGFEPLLLRETTRSVVEGPGHTGLADVVQFIGRLRT